MRDSDDPDALGLAVARERKVWVRNRLTEMGIQRAEFWGWPNIYTYTKALGEQLVAAETEMVRSIVRPSIVESAKDYPFPGWNEGFTTTAPIVFLTLKGQRQLPANKKLILDITPVDQVAAVMLAVAAQSCVEQPKLAYQAATGDANPDNMERIIGFCGLFRRQEELKKDNGFRLFHEISARFEPFPVSPERFEKTSVPLMNKAAKKTSALLDRANPRWGGGRYEGVIKRIKQTVDTVEEQTREATEAFKMFLPFTVENAYVFRCDNVRALFNRIREDEQQLLTWNPEQFDWYDYWMNIHLPGLKKWVLPTLEEDMRAKPKRVYTYRDLVELFETSTKRHETRVAMGIERDGSKEQYTYGDLRELSTRAEAFFASNGIKSADRVILFSDNAPEWGITYFGVLKAGATCIPIDAESATSEVVNFASAGAAAAIVISQRLLDEHDDLRAKLSTAGLNDVRIWTFDEVYELPAQEVEDERIALLPQRISPQSVASLIVTSGTTGRPKGVMLSHRNLTSMVSMLSSVFDMDTNYCVLSVLPLHHTFEFSTGFLTPISRGAQITYLDELNSENLAKAIKNGHVTGMVGVPALWELLHRRIKNRLHERSKAVGDTADLLMKINAWLRDKTPLNFGQILFYPIHEGMGGRIRYFISGGSALSEKIQRDFQGLGFTILEGYGLTEASPVLTVTRPENRMLSGTVGRPLPGVQIDIKDPDASGVGEVIARGPNVMLGYFGNEEATREALVDRWLYTGDLGRLDEDGNLYLVGRSKDIIVDTNGKNVYPDEVEEVYQDSSYIKELSVFGLPDGIGEKVACIVVPDKEYDIAMSEAELRAKIEEHFRDVSAKLPYYKRVKVLHFSDEELPRTATRKVKRREVLKIVQQMEAGRAEIGLEREEVSGDAAWLAEIVASVASRSVQEITLNSRLGDLGFDSLMFVELAAAIENAGGSLKAPDRLNEVQDVRELLTVVDREAAASRRDAPRLRLEPEKDEDIHVPEPVRIVGNKVVEIAQRTLYDRILRTKYEGQSNIPYHTNFIVAANHQSHLDMGLVKMALDDAGKDLVALAAADYFFDTKYKRAYMEHFTNLVPMERSGSLRQSLRHARSYLDRGYNALIFPEGTRSMTGTMADFKPVVGYLALAARIGILPLYLEGTYDAYPKGSTVLKRRDVGARIGRLISIEELEEMTDGLPRAEAYRLIAERVRHEVVNLRDRTNTKFDASAVHEEWRAERRAGKLRIEASDEEYAMANA